MILTLTNQAAHAVPIMSTDEGGWSASLEPGVSWALPYIDSSVVIIGNKPSVTEQIQQGLATIAKTVKALIATWQAHNNNLNEASEAGVKVAITNGGTQAVRVILGDGVHDYSVSPNETYQAQAWGYLELRELGDVNPTIDEQPSSAA